ncbi:hypothetical protein BAE44_0013160, partial [Dichanthelium oligosanthes]
MAGVASLSTLALRRAPSPPPPAAPPSPRRASLAYPGRPHLPSLRAARRVPTRAVAAGGGPGPEDEWGLEPEGGSAAVAEAPAPEEASEVAGLKAALKEA